MNCENCESCKNKVETVVVPLIVHETAVASLERVVKRLWILALTLIFLLVGTNAAWIWYESQFEEVVVTQENADGYNNFIGNDGDIINGETNDKN